MEVVYGEENKEDYGLIRPSLIKQLRAILDQYPDNGQILKELLQNAEDAGAKTVRFIYDQHSYDCTDLHHPEMAQFQGPALYAYNDALFSEQDWLGIRMLQESVKENDSMKIGRFGLGFKSCLHLTDLPSVLSGEKLFFIDPHEKYFLYKGSRTSGYMWNLKEKRKEMSRVRYHFEPFHDILSKFDDSFDGDFFRGTLFRFPLRQIPSELCSTVYDEERVGELFAQFESDAHLFLIFLKNIERLELYVRRDVQEKPQLIFDLSIRLECLDTVRRCRKCFVETVHRGSSLKEDVSMTYPLDICTSKYVRNGVTENRTFQFLVNEFHVGTVTTQSVRSLREGLDLSLIPLVGVAMEIGTNREAESEKLNDRKEETNVLSNKDLRLDDVCLNPKGQVFCFLPLPNEEKSASGLPVHVNGYFAISQNRRHLKWPSLGQKVESDKSLLWNRCLLSEILPLSYKELLVHATRSSKVSVHDLYLAIPNLVVVDEKWQIVLEPFFRSLFDLPIFYTALGGGKWIGAEECIFDCMREDLETKRMIIDILISGGVRVVEVKQHILHALGAFSNHSPEIITPGILRDVLRVNRALYVNYDRAQKFQLLRYVLKEEDFPALNGIELLPLHNKQFVKFGKKEQPVYITTDEFPAELLPTLNGWLVADDLDDYTKQKFYKLVQSRCSQVQYLTADSVAMLLRKAIPDSWCKQDIIIFDGSDVPADWLPLLWKHLRTHHPSNLSIFTGLPILPVTNGSPMMLVQLFNASRVVLQSALGATLSPGVERILKALGAFVVLELPQFVRDHAGVMGIYVKVPVAEDVVEVLYNVCIKKGIKQTMEVFRSTITAAEKSDLVELISHLQPKCIGRTYLAFLSQLPIFRCFGGETNDETGFGSVVQVKRATTTKHLPAATRERYLDASTETSCKAALLLGATLVSSATILRDTVTAEFKTGAKDASKAESVARDIFSRFADYCAEDPSLPAMLSNVPFVKTGCGRMECPSRLFDPESVELKQILAGADVFPVDFYSLPENLQHLRKMGLKSEKDLSAEDLLNAMRRIEQTVKTRGADQSVCDTSIAVLCFLNRNPALLWKEIVGKLLVKHSLKVSWVATLKEKPAFYPTSIDVFSGEIVYPPCRVKNTEWLPVIGAVRPIVAVQCSTEVARSFGWDTVPDLDSIVDQLCCVVRSYDSQQKVQFLTMIMALYEYLSRFDAVSVSKSLRNRNLEKWIWHGNGFASVEELTFVASAIDLQPHMFVLPSELQPYTKFFARCGVAEKCSQKALVKTLHKVKASCDDTGKDNDSQRVLAMVINILNMLAKDGIAPDSVAELDLLIPCGVGAGGGSFRLLPVSDCTYCDTDWVRKGFTLLDFDDTDGISFVHPQLPTATAETLQVPTLMSRMLNAEELEISSFGQSEPLTGRLKRLLEDYTDGLAIPKELIQNADDAGATEVRFLYDERQNLDAMKYLIDEGMKACQGPALWAYNNAVFTDKDFESIIRLGGATKQMETDKIGKFGLGFNAVYNITDVPSFVTRNTVVVFDPHTTHLERGIRDRSKPGIKLDLRKNETLLRKLPDQFKPYQDVFGCRIFDGGEKGFPGTLFRLPLRTKEQAARSEISGLHYDREQVIGLLDMLMNSASHLLLFTQSVQKLSFFYLPDEGCPSEPLRVLTVEKNITRIVRDVTPIVDGKALNVRNDAEKAVGCSRRMLQTSSEFLNQIKISTNKKLKFRAPESSFVVKISVSLSDSVLISKPRESAETCWFISQSFGKGSSFYKAFKSNEGFIPVAGVACLLEPREDGFVPVSIDGESRNGRVFCFLPIPMATRLPVHINGCFALHSDRRCLSFKTEDDKTYARVDWNRALLEDSVTTAYIHLLQDATFLLPPSFESGLFDIWPSTDVDANFLPLVESLYKSAAGVSANVPLLYSGNMAIPSKNVVFLESSIDNSQLFQKVASQILSSRLQNGKMVGLMADCVIKTFVSFRLDDFVEQKICSIEKFFRVIFLPNVGVVSEDVRNSLIIFAINQGSVALDSLLRESACVPASPDGSTLRKPRELVHPSSPLSHLFDLEDGRFPFGDGFCSQTLLSKLEKLGMRSSNITWEDVIERGLAMQALLEKDADKAKARLEMLLTFIDRIIMREQKVSSETQVSGLMDQGEAQAKLMEIAFLTCLTKPLDFPLKWIGEESSSQLHCPSNLYTFENRYLVSATSYIVDDKRMSYRVRDFLRFIGKRATIEQVLTQMEHAFNVEIPKLSSQQYEELQNCVYAIYGFLQEQCLANDEIAEKVSEILRDRQCILIDGAYVYPSQISTNFAYNCTPYLYGLSCDFVKRFHSLLKMLNVKEQFEVKDYMSVIQNLKQVNGNSILNPKDLDLSIRLVTQLNNAMKIKNVSAVNVEAEHGPIFIPSIKGILQPASSLCYNDCPWIVETSSMSFAHPEITFHTSACLGVRTKCQEALRRNARGIPFGQRERLTNSLKRILLSYPFDQEILKELIQNADDAGATVIHFVQDFRHHPTNHIFEQQWKPLQGPALCVYNNSPFTDKDLVGIQQLGEGSKSLDFSKTGQYGIGFSSVYHLTDAPSLLTTGADGCKKLCVFDPHCRYVPGATQTEPGMQFENIDDLRDAFPDVFRCYLEDQFNANNSTIFRLPLRTREMAETSEISKTAVAMSKVQSILDQLKEELFEILLFTNHLEEVIISDVDPNTGSLINTYNVKALVSKEDRKKRHNLAAVAQKCSASLKLEAELSAMNRSEEAICTVIMSDNRGIQENWIVVQHFGFGDSMTIPEQVEVAIKNGELALLPRGGVACLIERRQHSRIEPLSRPSRVFCFLPLPIETELPVHINGHFALGYENRRHLWTNSESDGYKRIWNALLCTNVIAPSYASLMRALRMVGLSGKLVNDVARVSCSQLILDAAMKAYQAFLPRFSETKPQWNVLTKATYQFVAENNVPVLPCICEENFGQTLRNGGPRASNEVQHWLITWLPPNGCGTNKAFFQKNDKHATADDQKSQASFIGKVKNWFGKPWAAKEKSNEEILRDVLLDCGLKLIEASNEVCGNFSRSGVDIDYMTPDGILIFFSSFSDDEPMCDVGNLPQPLPSTPFQNEKTLVLVLDYVKKSFEFEKKLVGLPLLLTADNMLRQFSAEEPVLYSAFSNLLPNSAHRFLKPSLMDTSFSKELLSESDVFQEFRIGNLAEMLHLKLPKDTFSNGVEKVDWVKTFSSVPNEKWMQMLWSYISSQLDPILKDAVTSDVEKTALVTKELAPLNSWCLVPARSPAGNCLFSLESAKLIVDFGSREYQTLGFRSVIQKLRLPQLDVNAINSDYCNNLDVLQHLVSTLDKPGRVVELLQRQFFDQTITHVALTKEDCDYVLKYICDNVEMLKADESAAEKIRSLPIYRTIFGDVISLTNCLVYTLPAKIPTNGVDIWQSKSGTVFLERNDKVQDLYNLLGCASISVIDVYCQFIFQHFEYFSLEDRLVHLYHIYLRYLNDGGATQPLGDEEKEGLLESLRELPFLEDEDGELQCANHFYDPENVVFKIMEPAGRFAPKAEKMFKESEWYSFLAILGMVKEVSSSMFLEFTRMVAREGQDPKSPSALLKSKVLVQHLYTLSDGLMDPILDDIVDVPFVATETASHNLLELFQQHGDLGSGKLAYAPFRNSISKVHEKLCWTCANLLPAWADPMNQTAMSPIQKEHVMQKLAIQMLPDVKTVLDQLELLCNNAAANGPLPTAAGRATRLEVFRAIYKHLANQEELLTEIKEKLEKLPCVLVDDAKVFVFPRQTVINIYDTEEIRPYLYKLPVEFGEYQRLFVSIGTTNRATPGQFVDVMNQLRTNAGTSKLTPNELKTAFKAVRGLLETLENSSASDLPGSCLYLPSEKGKLQDVTRLVFNDAPSYYDRVKEYNLQFLFDVRECGIRGRNVDELINLLPMKMRPAMLSTYVQEVLVPSSRQTVSAKGIANLLSQRLKSEKFLEAIVRLIRHEANKKGKKLDEKGMFSVLDRLSVISVYTVPSVVTHLCFKGKPIVGSEMEKTCFVERLPGATTDLRIRNIYVRDDTTFSQEMLIPLAEVVNSILSGMLHDSILYLLPILSCPEEKIHTKLDHLNIRLDHSSKVLAKVPTLPQPGSAVDPEIQSLCSWGQIAFSPEEYVAYRDNPEDVLIYGIILEELMSPDDNRIYLINLGSGRDGVIASVSKLYKLMRK